MGKGQSYLALKSWHPSTLKNQERVWKAEQEQIQRQKQEIERARQLAKERDHEDTKSLVSDKGDRHGVSWMYNAPTSSEQKNEPTPADEQQSVDSNKRQHGASLSTQHGHQSKQSAHTASNKRAKHLDAATDRKHAPPTHVPIPIDEDPMTVLWNHSRPTMLNDGVVGGRDDMKNELYQLVLDEEDESHRVVNAAQRKPTVKTEEQQRHTPAHVTVKPTSSIKSSTLVTQPNSDSSQPSLDSMSEAEMLAYLRQLKRQRRKLSHRVMKRSRSPSNDL